jgi:hypothetical protein
MTFVDRRTRCFMAWEASFTRGQSLLQDMLDQHCKNATTSQRWLYAALAWVAYFSLFRMALYHLDQAYRKRKLSKNDAINRTLQILTDDPMISLTEIARQIRRPGRRCMTTLTNSRRQGNCIGMDR